MNFYLSNRHGAALVLMAVKVGASLSRLGAAASRAANGPTAGARPPQRQPGPIALIRRSNYIINLANSLLSSARERAAPGVSWNIN